MYEVMQAVFREIRSGGFVVELLKIGINKHPSKDLLVVLNWQPDSEYTGI
jgi:hypothetical protein